MQNHENGPSTFLCLFWLQQLQQLSVDDLDRAASLHRDSKFSLVYLLQTQPPTPLSGAFCELGLLTKRTPESRHGGSLTPRQGKKAGTFYILVSGENLVLLCPPQRHWGKWNGKALQKKGDLERRKSPLCHFQDFDCRTTSSRLVCLNSNCPARRPNHPCLGRPSEALARGARELLHPSLCTCTPLYAHAPVLSFCVSQLRWLQSFHSFTGQLSALYIVSTKACIKMEQ